MELKENLILFVGVTVLGALITSQGYHNVAYWLRTRLNNKRETTVSEVSTGGTKKQKAVKRQKKDQERITNIETISFSILYNNALYLFLFLFLALFALRNAYSPYNYAVSVSISSGALAIFSAMSL